MKIAKSLLLIFSIILLSCKKNNDEQQSFPITFYMEKAQAVSDIRVYTKNGEIKDAQKIAQLVKNSNNYFQAEEFLNRTTSSYLTFLSRDSATFNNSYFRYQVKRSGDQFLFTSAITSVSPLPIFPDQIRYHLLKYEDVRFDNNAVFRKDVQIAYGDYKTLKIPAFGYLVSSGLETPVIGLSRIGGLVTNEFDESSLNRLGNKDTIAIKTYTIMLKAR